MSSRTGPNRVTLLLMAVVATLAIPHAASPLITPTAPVGAGPKRPLTFIESNIAPGELRTLNYTVPHGKQFVVTDITVANENDRSGVFGTGLAKVIFLDESMIAGKLPNIVVQSDDTVDISYQTGPVCGEGSQITVLSVIGGTTVHVYLAGYETNRLRD